MRTVIISHNINPEYAFFEPVVKWAWKRLGWNCHCIVSPTALEAQCVRLYAGDIFLGDTMLMTSDIDMLPLSDYWHPKNHEITCYGRNLSDEHQPVCYVAMQAKLWSTFFPSRNAEKNIKEFAQGWTTDQNILTNLLPKEVINIDRPIDPATGYPIGRIDRSAWDRSLQQFLRIDAHLLRPGWTDKNWPRIMTLIEDCLNPTIDEIKWLNNYRNEYKNSIC